jgi:murein L,D-transpeptidase YafK
MKFIFRWHAALLFFILLSCALYSQVPSSARSVKAITKNAPILEKGLIEKGLEIGSPIFIRIFKAEGELELWIEGKDGYKLFKTYEVCSFSGELGPKIKQGDMQSPEGFYFITAGRMNPWSDFHLSINLGFPNRYDRIKGYSGNYLMIHGNCVSIGCYAMTDAGIEEIYTLAEKALNNGQSFFRVHIFPFRMNSENMRKYHKSPWNSFWGNLKTGYDRFEEELTPPNVEVENGIYVFN